MRFFEINEIWAWCEERGIALEEGGVRPARDPQLLHCSQAHYAGGARSDREAAVARTALEALGPWDECLVWITLTGVWSSTEDWPKFYAFRGAQGERRSIDVAPGHWVGAEERSLLPPLLAQVLQNGWDAYVLPIVAGRQTGRRLFVSHDEFIELQSETPGEIRQAAV